jgi:signal-transduction protein with cAMP-binding, CBS, and nucleotidyltransferase domain
MVDVESLSADLQLCELFSTLEPEEIKTLIAHGTMKEIPRGKILYMKGSQSDDTFCFLIAGAVNVVAKDGHVVKEIPEGSVIGEVALSNPHKLRTVTVITKEPSETIEWNANVIKEKIPTLWKKLLKLAWKTISEYYEE